MLFGSAAYSEGIDPSRCTMPSTPGKQPIEEDESVVAVLFPHNEKAWLESFLRLACAVREIRKIWIPCLGALMTRFLAFIVLYVRVPFLQVFPFFVILGAGSRCFFWTLRLTVECAKAFGLCTSCS